MKKGLLIVLAILAIVLIGGCGAYKNWQNDLNGSRQEVKKAWADVQNQYQRRGDLVPNLVSTVKGAAAHERETLEAVINARAKATSIQVNSDDLTPEKMAQYQAAQGELSQALGRLMMVAEAYPNLKANENFLNLQTQLEGTENRIAVARRDYNQTVMVYNTKVTNFPTNLVANSLGFKEVPEFQADAANQKAPDVSF